MRWILKRKIADLRGAEPFTETWYYLGKDGAWTVDIRRARIFSNLHEAEHLVEPFGGPVTARVEPEQR